MAWEQRGSRTYYYRKRREGDRVISEYIGSDMTARLCAQLDRIEREKILATQIKWREQKSELAESDPDYEFLTVVVRGLIRATFLTSGYHPYKGQWRKKRHEK